MSNLQILSKSIRTFENLYSLNDLHRVGGGEDKHRPTFFVRLETTQDLVSELQKQDPHCQPLKSINGGVNRGTYACKELVIAYAAWISPAFHLTVLRAFLDQAEHSQNQPQIAPLEKEFHLTHTNDDLKAIAWTWFEAYRMAEFLKRIEPALRTLQSPLAAEAYSMGHEYGWHIENTAKLIHRITQGVDYGNRPTPAVHLEKVLKPKPKAVKHYDF